MHRCLNLTLVTLLLASLEVLAQARPHVSYVPAVARTGGINGSFWVSDVRVFNPAATPATVDAYLLGTGDSSAAVPVTFTVPAGTATTWDDVLSSLFHLSSGAGALKLASDQPVAVTSVLSTRAALCANDAAVVTQWIPAVAHAGASTKQRIHHFTSSTAVRANVGVVNVTEQPANLTLRLIDVSGGGVIGEGVLRLPPYAWYQVNNFTGQLFLFEDVPAGMVEITSDVPVLGYASMVTNQTNDAFTVVGQSFD